MRLVKNPRYLWNALFGQQAPSDEIPGWLVHPIRFGYLVVQEFIRNRCLEKASALGFQTVFSLIPALVLALFFTRSFGGLQNLSGDVTRFILHQLHVDEIYLNLPNLEGEPASQEHRKTQATDSASSEPATAPSPEDQSPAESVKPPPASAPTGEPPSADSQRGRLTHTKKLVDQLQDQIDHVDSLLRSGSVSIISLFWLIVAAMSLALTMEHSLNDIWGATGRRRLLRRIALYWSVLTLGPLLVGFSMYAARLIVAPVAWEDLIISTLGPLVAFYVMYQLVPSAPVQPSAAILGALTAAVAWQIAKYGFGLYVQHAVGYGKLYGNLGLLPIFLFWIWIVWVIMLAGAEVAYTLQNQDRLTAAERRRRGAPFIQPGLVALGLVLHAGRAFMSGKGPVSDEELALSTGMPDHVWHRLVSLLVDRRILVEAGADGSGFTPARPLEALTVEEIFAAVEDSLVARPDESWHPEQEQLQGLANLLARARQRELGRTSIADLLADQSAETASPVTGSQEAVRQPSG